MKKKPTGVKTSARMTGVSPVTQTALVDTKRESNQLRLAPSRIDTGSLSSTVPASMTARKLMSILNGALDANLPAFDRWAITFPPFCGFLSAGQGAP